MIHELKKRIQDHSAEIEAWFEAKKNGLPLSLYLSVDLRNSHRKIAIVDTNAYPAGFNNLCRHGEADLGRAFRAYVEARFPSAQRLLLVPEAHTRNPNYLENVYHLAEALKRAGYELRLGLPPAPGGPELPFRASVLGGELVYHPVTQQDGRIATGDYSPDLVILNNDLRGGIPAVLQNIAQPIIPAAELGWYRRKKSEHFSLLNELTAEFSGVVGLDPQFLVPATELHAGVDFDSAVGRESLARQVDAMLDRLRRDRPTELTDEPFVFIKDESGTYGMAIMTAFSGDEVRKASHRTRTKMRLGKGRSKVTDVILQEGVMTRDTLGGCPMEPVIYLVGDRPVGGFFRVHCERNPQQNLNVTGMTFNTLCFHDLEGRPEEVVDDECCSHADLFLVYGTLGRIAALALAQELKRALPAGAGGN